MAVQSVTSSTKESLLAGMLLNSLAQEKAGVTDEERCISIYQIVDSRGTEDFTTRRWRGPSTQYLCP